MKIFLRLLFLCAAVSAGGAQITARNVTDMVSRDTTYIADNTIIDLLGYHEPGDGGGGRFIINRTVDTDSLAYQYGEGGIWFEPVSGTGHFERIEKDIIDFRAFGATPDDTSLDTEQIQRLANYLRFREPRPDIRTGGIMYMGGPGDYYIDDTILLGPKVTWDGPGSNPGNWSNDAPIGSDYNANLFLIHNFGDTQLVLVGGANKPMIRVYSDPEVDYVNAIQPNEVQEDGSVMTTYVQAGGIRNVALYEQFGQTRADCHAIVIEGKFFYKIQNVAIINTFGYMIFGRDVNGLVLSEVYGSAMGNVKTKGLLFQGSGDCHIYDCHFGGQSGPGIWFSGQSAGHGAFNGNYVFNAQDYKYRVTSAVDGTGEITLGSDHTYETGMPVEWRAEEGTPPGNVSESFMYWAIKTASNKLKLASTIANAQAGTAITFSSPYTGATNWIWHGPGVSFYGSSGTKLVSLVNNRFEQNERGSVELSAASNVSMVGNDFHDNGFNTKGQVPAEGTTFGVHIRNGTGTHGPITLQGNVYRANNPNYTETHAIWIAENYAVNTNRTVLIMENPGNVSGDRIRIDDGNEHVSVTIPNTDVFGGMQLGHPEINNPVVIRGESRLLELDRGDFHGRYTITPSGQTLKIEQQHADLTFTTAAALSTVNTNFTVLYLGGNEGLYPHSTAVYGMDSNEEATPSGHLLLAPGRGFGPTVEAGIRIQSLDGGAGEFDPQVRFDALAIYGRSAQLNANLSIEDGRKITLDSETLAGWSSAGSGAGIILTDQRPVVVGRVNSTNIPSMQWSHSTTIGLSLDLGGSTVQPFVFPGSITATHLNSSGVVAGSYSSANVTVDEDGRITAISNGSGEGEGLGDGVYGDVTVSGSGTVMTVNSGAIAYSELSGMPAELEALIIDDDGSALQNLNGANVTAGSLPLTAVDIDDMEDGELLGIAGGVLGPIPFGDTDTVNVEFDGTGYSWNYITNDLPLLSRPYNKFEGEVEADKFTAGEFDIATATITTLDVDNLSIQGTNIHTLLSYNPISSLGVYSSGVNFVVDMAGDKGKTVSLTGNFNLIHVTNAPAGLEVVNVRLFADGGNRTITVNNAYHRNVGFTSGTTVLTNGTVGLLSVQSWGHNTNVIIGYAPFPHP